MILVPVTDARKSDKAFAALKKQLARGCQKFSTIIGWHGGNCEAIVFWNPRERFWFGHDWADAGNRFWSPFGTEDPRSKRMLNITVQCNPPLKRVNRQCAGAFVTDGSEIFLAHSGKIAGGKKGIGKTAFVNSYPQGNWQPVRWPDNRESEMIIIGRVDSPAISRHIGQFIREVEKLKEKIEAGFGQSLENKLRSGFSPEFAGKRKRYRLVGDVESSCDHGVVVNELEKCLRDIGFDRLGKDQPRDLYILSKGSTLHVLFEVKVDVTTTNLYQGIGQLLYHGFVAEKPPRRIFVLPEKPKAKTAAILAGLGIEVLTFTWKGARPVFKELRKLLK